MQKIEVVIQSECLGGVSEALRKARIALFRACDIKTFDPAAPPGSYRGASYAVGREQVKLELLVRDHELEPAVEAIREGIDALGIGDAELLVLSVQDSVRLSPSPWTRRSAIG
jgi:nitrogen regulatory protein PII